MANIKINNLEPTEFEFAELSSQKLKAIHGGGSGDIVGGAITGFVVGSAFGMPIFGAIVGGIAGALLR